MERREFVRTAVAGAALRATAGPSAALRSAQDDNLGAKAQQEFYQLRKYELRNGPQTTLTQGYFEKALIPALGRLGMGPVGAFKLDIGPQTPTYYVLIPATDAEALVTLDARLGKDAEYVKAAAGFRDAPATAPAFERSERSLLGAFAGWPKLVAPKLVDGKLPKRIFQLRTYESASQAAHARKVAMFNEAEIGIFVRTGLTPVFFGDTLIGTRMPSLTYMLTFADTAELEAKWDVFRNDPAWKKLSADPRFAFDPIVMNIGNLMLSPLDCSQI